MPGKWGGFWSKETKGDLLSVPHLLQLFFSLLELWLLLSKGTAASAIPAQIWMGLSLPCSIKDPSRHNKTGQLPWATLLMQSKYCSPFSSNRYCRWARTTLRGSAAKKTLQEGLEIMKGNTLVYQGCSERFLLGGGHCKWKLQLYKGKGKHNLGDTFENKFISAWKLSS